MQLVRYDKARRALAACANIDEAKDIRDKAAALKAYAEQRGDLELERWVTEIKLRAIRRIGELSRELDASKGGANPAATLPDGGKSKSSVLKAAGLSTSTAYRAEQLAEIPELVFEKYLAKRSAAGKPVNYGDAIHAITRQRAEDQRRGELHRPLADLPAGIRWGDFRELASEIADNSVELVFTDPPYDRDSIPLFSDAAKEAARILKPGGSFIAYCGHIQLPEVLLTCSQHLRYWWTIANIHAGGETWMQRYGIHASWKPLVWFVKGTRGDVQTPVTDVISGGREKTHHTWQQAASEAAYYIEKLTAPTGLVVDFFLGSGTTAVAAQSLGRPFLGFEIDRDAVASASDRLNTK